MHSIDLLDRNDTVRSLGGAAQAGRRKHDTGRGLPAIQFVKGKSDHRAGFALGGYVIQSSIVSLGPVAAHRERRIPGLCSRRVVHTSSMVRRVRSYLSDTSEDARRGLAVAGASSRSPPTDSSVAQGKFTC